MLYNYLLIVLNQMSRPEIENKIKQISLNYEQLKKCQTLQSKIQMSQQLIGLCVNLQKILQSQIPSTKIFRHQKQISNIKSTAMQIKGESMDLLANKKTKYDIQSESVKIGSPSHINQLADKQKQLSKKICFKIIQQEVSSKQLKISNQQLEQLADRMQNNNYINQQIKSIIIQHGQNLDLLENNIQKALENTEIANTDLKNAAEIQLLTRIKKIKLGLAGLIAGIGYGILGIPGLIAGAVIGLYKTVF